MSTGRVCLNGDAQKRMFENQEIKSHLRGSRPRSYKRQATCPCVKGMSTPLDGGAQLRRLQSGLVPCQLQVGILLLQPVLQSLHTGVQRLAL